MCQNVWSLEWSIFTLVISTMQPAWGVDPATYLYERKMIKKYEISIFVFLLFWQIKYDKNYCTMHLMYNGNQKRGDHVINIFTLIFHLPTTLFHLLMSAWNSIRPIVNRLLLKNTKGYFVQINILYILIRIIIQNQQT